MKILSSILIVMLLTQNIVYGEELEIVTIPEKLVNNSRAMLIIHYKDQTLPFTPTIENILSSDRTIINVNTNTLRSIGNNLVVDLDLINRGKASITVIKSGEIISKTFEVYGSNDIPVKILMKVLPSSFSYLGPSSGYITIQLLNTAGMPIKAERDYIIELSSSNPNIVSLDNIIIKKGEYFGIKKFDVRGYGDVIIKARYNDLVTEAKIKVNGYNSTILKLYIAPEIAPAMKGQRVYAFVQLQDTNGNPIYAESDMNIDLKASTDDIITSSITIKKGESIGIGELIINTDKSCSDVNIDLSSRNDFNPCIELYAITDNLKSRSAYLEVREYATDNYIQEVNSIVSLKPKLIPILQPSDLPIIADGKEKVIGVIQLMSYEGDKFNLATAKPVVPTHSIMIKSNEELIELRDIIIEKPYSTTLVKAKVGYLGGDAKVELFGDRLVESITDIKLYGHKDLKMIAEPLIDKVVKGINFPYLIYFIDKESTASYSLTDLNMLISMSNEIVSIEPRSIKKGSDLTLFDAIALREGSSEIIFEGVSSLEYIQTISNITVIDQKARKIELSIQDRLVKNSKGLASIQLVDGSGFPTIIEEDLNAYIYTSNRLLNIPKVVTIPAGEYYTIFPIESYNSTGRVEVRVFIDGFESIGKSIEIIDDNIELVMESNELRVNEELTLTLKALYKDEPLVGAYIRWENNKGLPLEYDTSTDNDGVARAKYLITEEGEHIFKAKVNYKGLEREAEVRLNSRVNDKSVSYVNDSIQSAEDDTSIPKDESIQSAEDDTSIPKESSRFEPPIDIKYLLIMPALAGIALSILRKRKP